MRPTSPTTELKNIFAHGQKSIKDGIVTITTPTGQFSYPEGGESEQYLQKCAANVLRRYTSHGRPTLQDVYQWFDAHRHLISACRQLAAAYRSAPDEKSAARYRTALISTCDRRASKFYDPLPDLLHVIATLPPAWCN